MTSMSSEEEVSQAYDTLFQTFASGATKSLTWRKWQLKQCWWMIEENEDALCAALYEDLHRHVYETTFLELSSVKRAILEHITNLELWAAEESPNIGFPMKLIMRARIRHEPLGVALIISAWNFPIDSLLEPLLSAIAAGCCVMLKPSELAPATQRCLASLVPKYLDQNAIRLVTGGPRETSRILERRFNHIFFTGSSKIARFITAAAAKHLTPTVLELGGQGPAIVTQTADIDVAAKRIASLKVINAGQMCLGVNHVFVDPSVHDQFVDRLRFWFETFLGNSSEECSRVIDDRNYNRLMGILDRTHGDVFRQGGKSLDEKIIGPTIVTNVGIDGEYFIFIFTAKRTNKILMPADAVLQEELFGPILPVIKADYVSAYQTIQRMEHPLAMYIFGTDKSQIDEILNSTNSGGVTINDVIMHAILPNVPFGGVGESGQGKYHGKFGFLEFSHQRPVVNSPTWFDRFLSFRYPPYRMENMNKIKVENSLGFKRGETQTDQKIRGPVSLKLQSLFGYW